MTNAQDMLSKTYTSIDVNNTVAQLMGKLKRAKTHAALVFDGTKYLGVVSRRFLLTSRIDPKKMKVGNIVKKRSKSKAPFYVPKLALSDDLTKIGKLMAASDTHMLPVIEKNKVLGVVYSTDLAQAIAAEYGNVSCDDLATMEPITVTPEDDIGTAINLFNRNGIDHLPVVDKKDRLVGMVSMSDLLEHPEFWSIQGRHISNSHKRGKSTGYGTGEKTKMTSLPVRNCMNRKDPCCAQQRMKIPEAVQLMADNNVPSIVLIKYEKPVGILTIKDILTDYAK